MCEIENAVRVLTVYMFKPRTKKKKDYFKKTKHFNLDLVLSDPSYILYQTGTLHDSISPKGNCGSVSLNLFFFLFPVLAILG